MGILGTGTSAGSTVRKAGHRQRVAARMFHSSSWDVSPRPDLLCIHHSHRALLTHWPRQPKAAQTVSCQGLASFSKPCTDLVDPAKPVEPVELTELRMAQLLSSGWRCFLNVQ